MRWSVHWQRNKHSCKASSTSAFYVRAEGICDTTGCSTKIIVVDQLSIPADSVTSVNAAICYGSATTLNLSGGYLGSNAEWNWYSGSCGGQYIGSGISIIVSPSSTSAFYARAEGICDTTGCSTKIIIVDQLSMPADSVSSVNVAVCYGSGTTLSLSGGSSGSNADWSWYSGSCGGQYLGSGIRLTIRPAVTSFYYARAEGICNSTGCSSISLIVIDVPSQPSDISGNIDPRFKNNSNLQCSN